MFEGLILVGPGIWILDMAQTAPSTVQFTGIDIDKRMYPNKYPSNVTFDIGSVLSLPSQWTSKYDIVHQRLLAAGLQRPQWELALKEIYRVLKPGGWVQLVEVDLANMGVGPESTRLAQVQKTIFALKNLDITIADNLPGIVKKVGFAEIRAIDYPYVLYGSALPNVKAREMMYRGHSGIKGPITELGGLGYVKDGGDFDKMREGALKEWEAIKSDPLRIRVVCARKPPASARNRWIVFVVALGLLLLATIRWVEGTIEPETFNVIV